MSSAPPSSHSKAPGWCRMVGSLLWGLIIASCQRSSPDSPSEHPKALTLPERPNFAEHIAPIIFQNCSPCHRPGESAPFSLLSFEDAAKRSKMIAKVTSERLMPPWLPAMDGAHYEGERRLTSDQIELLRRWHEQGALAGDPSKAPPVPTFTPGWQLGPPDLVVKFPSSYLLAAEGEDVYRHFVLPIPIDEKKYISAIEFRPDNAAYHHAFMLFDSTRESRRLDALDREAGFPGMDPGTGAQSPQGHFISWQPGKRVQPNPKGLNWVLKSGTDLVLQLHLKPSGKEELLSPQIGFYFSPEPPQRQPFKLVLMSNDIDIPAGEGNWSFEKRYTLPIDAEALAVIPHAHYLGKQLHSWAELPGGLKKWLCKIDSWDFNWQGDYRFADPVTLPKGSVIVQRFTYDNSAANPHNPFQPPQRAVRGLKTTDEMGEMWIQLLPSKPADLATLQRDYTRYGATQRVSDLEKKVAAQTATAHDYEEMAKALLVLGKTHEAMQAAKTAESMPGASAEAPYVQGFIAARTGDPDAKSALQRAVALNPAHPASLNGLGMLALREAAYEEAIGYFRKSAEADPQNPTPWQNLAKAYQQAGDMKSYQEALVKAAMLEK